MANRIRHASADEIDTFETEQDRPMPLTMAAPSVALTEAANPNIIFFDVPLAYAYNHGLASITLTVRRQLVDASGQVFEDAVISGLLRASLPSLKHLKQVITEIEKLAKKAEIAAAAAAEMPDRLAH